MDVNRCAQVILDYFGDQLQPLCADRADKLQIDEISAWLLIHIGLPIGRQYWYEFPSDQVESYHKVPYGHFAYTRIGTLDPMKLRSANPAMLLIKCSSERRSNLVCWYPDEGRHYNACEHLVVFLACLAIWMEEHDLAVRRPDGEFADARRVSSRLRQRMLECSPNAMKGFWSYEVADVSYGMDPV